MILRAIKRKFRKKVEISRTPMQAYYNKRLLDNVLALSMREKCSKAVAPNLPKSGGKEVRFMKHETFGKNDAFLMLRREINGEENIRRVSKDELPRLLESPYFISVGCYHKYPNMIYGEVGIFERKIIVVCMGGEQK